MIPEHQQGGIMDSSSNNVVDKRVVKLEHIMQKEYIPFLGGRPERQKVIGGDDVANVSILVNTANTVEEFLSKI
jgi:hypothetical protein